MSNKNHNSSYISLVLIGVVACVGSNSLLLSPILTDVSEGLETTAATTARAIAGYGGATALSALVLAPMIDRFGSRRMLLRGLAALTTGVGLSAAAGDWITLTLAQALAGLGAGVVLPATYALATKTAPRGQEARLLGRVLTGWSISMVLGVPAAALVADLLGWRACFIVLDLISLASLAALLRVPEDAGDHDSETATYLRRLRTHFTWRIGLLLVVCFAYMIAFYGVYPFIGDHARRSLGASTSFAGLYALSYGLGFGAASLADGLLDRFQPAKLFPVALLAIGVSYAALAQSTRDAGLMLGVCLLWGFLNHFGLNILVLLLSSAAGTARGAILGINSAVTYLGVLCGAALFGPLYESAGLETIALLAAGALVVAATLAWSLRVRQTALEQS